MAARSTSSIAVSPSKYPALNPYTQPIPQPAANLENLAACVMALKTNVENLTGQRGSPPDRAVTFTDLVNYGILAPDAVTSANGKFVVDVTPIGGPFLPLTGGTLTGSLNSDLHLSGNITADLRVNDIKILSDTITAPFPNPPNIFGFNVDYTTSDGISNATRFALAGQMFANGKPASDSSTVSFCGVLGLAYANTPDPGPNAWIGALNANVAINPGCTGWNEVCSAEFDITICAAVSQKEGIKIVQAVNSTHAGDLIDGAIVWASQPGAIGWENLMLVRVDVENPLSTTASIFSTYAPDGSVTIANGIDFTNFDFTGYAFKSLGFSVDGAGRVAIVNPFPPGATGSTNPPITSIDVNIGGYPASGVMPPVQGISSSMLLPAGFAAEGNFMPNVPFGAYCWDQSSDADASVVGYFGVGSAHNTTPGAGNCWGYNFQLTNSVPQYAVSASGQGTNFNYLVGIEFNPNIWGVGSSTTAPTGQLDCIRFIGGGDPLRPTGPYTSGRRGAPRTSNSWAYMMHGYPLTGWGGSSPTSFNCGLYMEPGATIQWANIGAAMPGNGQPSQDLVLNATSSSGTALSATMHLTSSGAVAYDAVLSVPGLGMLTGGENISFSPIGNPPTTLGSLVIQANTVSDITQREFALSVGLNVTTGHGGPAGNDKVPFYSAVTGRAGGSDIWAGNFVAEAYPGYYQGVHVCHILELDMNNKDSTQGDLTISTFPSSMPFPYSAAIDVSGDPADGSITFRNTVGFIVDGGSWFYGYMALGNDIEHAVYYENTNATLGLDLEGAHTAALAIGLAGNAPIAGAIDVRQGTDHRFVLRGPQHLADGWCLSSLNDANSGFKGIELEASQIYLWGNLTTPHGVVGQMSSLYSDYGANILRLSDRLFLGAAAAPTSGDSANTTLNWLSQLSQLTYLSQWAQEFVLSTSGTLGGVYGARSSDYPTFTGSGHSQATIALSAYGINDDTTAGGGVSGPDARATYFEARRNAGVLGVTQTSEIQIANLGTVVDIGANISPSAAAGCTVALTLASGAALSGSANVSAAIAIDQNQSLFRKGIVMCGGTLDPSVGASGGGVAMELPDSAAIRWVNSSTGAMEDAMWGAAGGVNLSGGMTAHGPLTVNQNTVTPAAYPYTQLWLIAADAAPPRLMLDGFGAPVNPNITWRIARGTAASPSAIQTNDVLGNIVVFGYGATGYSAGNRGAIVFGATENWTDTAQGTHFAINTAPIGTASTVTSLTLDDTGLTLNGGLMTTGTLTVATLPAAASHRGARALVSDASVTTFAAIVAGGGSSYAPVYCDGTNWRLG